MNGSGSGETRPGRKNGPILPASLPLMALHSTSTDNRDGHRSSQTMTKAPSLPLPLCLSLPLSPSPLIPSPSLSASASLCRLTRGLVGPAGNVWVRRPPSPRRKVAPQSLPTSWETPMPLVSPPALSCRIHASSPSSESHTSRPAFLFCPLLCTSHSKSVLFTC